jgi:hypothetical protein
LLARLPRRNDLKINRARIFYPRMANVNDPLAELR